MPGPPRIPASSADSAGLYLRATTMYARRAFGLGRESCEEKRKSLSECSLYSNMKPNADLTDRDD
jgi:hypothetical protein